MPTLLEVKDGYIGVTGEIGRLGVANKSRLTRYDGRGNIQWQQKIYFPDKQSRDSIFSPILGAVMAKDSAIYVFTSWLKDTVLRYYVNKFDQRGKLIWYRDYGLPTEGCYGRLHCIALAEDSLSIVIGGKVNEFRPPFDREHEMLVMRIRPDGSQAWASRIPIKDWRANTWEIPLTVLPDGSVYVAFGDDVVWREPQPYFLQLEKNGRVVGGKLNEYMGITADLKAHPTGNLVYYYRRRGTWGEPYTKPQGMTLRMLSPDLETVWDDVGFLSDDPETPIGGMSGYFTPAMAIRRNGDILIAGDLVRSGVLVAVSAAGKPLWNRKVRLGVNDTLQRAGRIYGVMWTADGGILVSGVFSYPNPPNGPRREKPYLMKLDGFGCLEPGCQIVNVGTKEAGNPPYAVRRLRISPNPATDQVRIDFSPATDEEGPRAIRVFDLSGRLHHQALVADHATQLTLSVGDWPSGLYWVSVISEKGVLWSGDFVR